MSRRRRRREEVRREDGNSSSKKKPCDMMWSKARDGWGVGLGGEQGDVEGDVGSREGT